MDKAISEIAGRIDLPSGEVGLAYRALRPLLCSACGIVIAEGALFTRHRVKGIGVNIMPRCQQCEPFILRPGKQEKSPLLKSLLSGSKSQSSERAESSPSDSSLPGSSFSDSPASEDGGKNVIEEMRKRLGPALRRGRRHSRLR